MLSPVIAGVDGSAESLAAAEWAAREALRRDRPLRLVHVRDRHPHGHSGEPANAVQRQPAPRGRRCSVSAVSYPMCSSPASRSTARLPRPC